MKDIVDVIFDLSSDFALLSSSLSDLISDLLLGVSWDPDELDDQSSASRDRILGVSVRTEFVSITAQSESITCPAGFRLWDTMGLCVVKTLNIASHGFP